MKNNKRPVFRVRFKEIGTGRDGGFGSVKSFRTTARDPQAATRKLRKKGVRVLSVRRAK